MEHATDIEATRASRTTSWCPWCQTPTHITEVWLVELDTHPDSVLTVSRCPDCGSTTA